MIYFANPCGPDVIAAMQSGKLGYIDTPAQGNIRPDDVAWCADNGCFSDKWDERKWWRFLERNASNTKTCLFAVAPDVVGDARRTGIKSLPWLERIRGLDYPVAWVAQDGQECLPLPWSGIDALFIGGSTDWKLGPAAAGLVREAKDREKWVHFGRVNSRKRWLYAKSLGCDSADGTFLTFGPKINLPKLLSWMGEDDGVPASLSLGIT